MAALDGRAGGGPNTAPDASPGQTLVSLGPVSAYEAVTRQMVVGLGEELREIKARLNGLLFMVAGSVLLEVVTRMTGGS